MNNYLGVFCMRSTNSEPCAAKRRVLGGIRDVQGITSEFFARIFVAMQGSSDAACVGARKEQLTKQCGKKTAKNRKLFLTHPLYQN